MTDISYAWPVPPRRDASTTNRRRRSAATAVAVVLALGVHAGLGVYLWKSKFEPVYRTYADAVTQVAIVRPAPVRPPPPPPPPPKVEDIPPPKAPPKVRPRLQPRPARRPPQIAPVPPLPVPPVVMHLDVIAPPAAVPIPQPRPAALKRPPVQPFITNPDWRQLPSASDMARYYPDGAQRRGVEGRATIGCRVTAGGSLERCRVVAESPEGYGFGSAAVKMSSRFKMRPMTKNGAPVAGGSVRIPIRFALPK